MIVTLFLFFALCVIIPSFQANAIVCQMQWVNEIGLQNPRYLETPCYLATLLPRYLEARLCEGEVLYSQHPWWRFSLVGFAYR